VIAVLLLIALTATAAAMAGVSLLEPRTARQRLARLGDTEQDDGPRIDLNEDAPGLREKLARFVAPLAGRAARTGARSYQSVTTRLVYAGFRTTSSLPIYMGSRVAVAMGMSTLGLGLPIVMGITDIRFVAAVLLAGGFGFILPGAFVDWRIKRRHAEIVRSLPDAIDLMVVCVEAGLNMVATLDRISKEYARTRRILALEFRIVVLETQAGKSTGDALRGLGTRTGVVDLGSLVAMLIQTERFGTSLVESLRVHSDALRVKRLQVAEETAQKASLKMLIPAGVFIFPATLLVSVGPGFLKILQVFK
jgi:tight adherence protein C